jgi:hypothetical protein
MHGTTETQIAERARSEREQRSTRRLACARCGRPVEHHRGRRPRFCSTRCRTRYHDEKRTRKAFLTRDTGAPTKQQKFVSKNNEVQRAKTRSSARIIAPNRVLLVEIFDRTWRPAVSTDGTSFEIARLRSRALVTRP